MNKIDNLAKKLVLLVCFALVGIPTIYVGIDYAVTQYNVNKWQDEVAVKVSERTKQDKEDWENKMNAMYKK